MMVIKATPFILSLYENHGLNIKTFDKTYQVSFMNRNDKDVKHLIIKITNNDHRKKFNITISISNA